MTIRRQIPLRVEDWFAERQPLTRPLKARSMACGAAAVVVRGVVGWSPPAEP